MPRYVLLRHELPPDSPRASHWDLMLEHEGVLWTWAIEKLPTPWLRQLNLSDEDAAEEVRATRLADHRLAYLDFEGPLTGDRGNVTRVAAGEHTLGDNTIDRVVAQLVGDFRGIITLGRRNVSTEVWQLTFTAEA